MNINEYFLEIEKKVREAYDIAEEARKKGFDPTDHVEIPISQDMADRVENLIAIINPLIKEIGLAKAIREFEAQYGPLEFKTILKIAEYAAQKIYEKTGDKVLAIELGLRAGFAYHTLGVVAAPTEGIVKVAAKKRRDGGEYIAVYYAGPVRSAGGTPTAFSVVIADFLRRKFGFQPWDPTDDEIQRYIVEIYDYKRVAHLQYTPTQEELEFLLRHVPIEVNGEATEDAEVSSYKGLPRIETDRIRGGVALVIAEGLVQKAKKIWKNLSKIAEELGLQDWSWLHDFVKLQEDIKAKLGGKESQKEEVEEEKIKPNWAYLKEITAGRPVFALPMAKGGFRLRYGKSRWNGHDAISLHPAISVLTYDFISVGTQLRVERPGKAGGVTYSDTIEPPVVKLKNGSVIRVESVKQAKEILKDVEEILFLGDMLVSFGDFVDAGHILVPAGYCEEWWVQELERAAMEKVEGFKVEFDMNKPRKLFNIEEIDKLSKYLGIDERKLEKYLRDPLKKKPTVEEAIVMSLKLEIPLHPRYTYHWKDVSSEDVYYLRDKIKSSQVVKNKISVGDLEVPVAVEIAIDYDQRTKKILEDLLIPHSLSDDKSKIIISYPESTALLAQLGLLFDEDKSVDQRDLRNGLEVVREIADVKVRDKVGTYIGARMGRPEKAKIREMKGSPMMLFPVGLEGGRMRNFIEAVNIGKIKSEFPIFYCEKCKRETIYPYCEICGSKTVQYYICTVCGAKTKQKEHCGKPTKPYTTKIIDPRKLLEIAIKNLGISPSEVPKIVKGVKGVTNKNKIVERIEKGILRARHGVFVFRDGTVRFDAIEIPVLYFRPKDLKYVTIEKLKELGYTHDIYGKPLEKPTQILELKPQDVILPTIGPMKKGGKILKDGFVKTLLNTAKFVDEELVRLYKMKPYYNAKTPEDLIGHLAIAMAPHTSAGTIVRIIGFSETQAFLAHPLVHAAMRRNCDGDEGGLILLMDALLNFSREYLPAKRGGTMDAPLTITLKIVPSEVDDEVHKYDVVWNYPLELYEAAERYESTDVVSIPILKSRLGKDEQYYNWGFMHDVKSFNVGNKVSAYKKLKTMMDKLNYQLKVARICRASDENKVGELVINLHFARDVKGNLRKFSSQEFRCVKCNTKYRRVPLSGKCEVCGGKLVFTVSKGSVTKYLDPSLWLSERLNFDPYTKSSLEVLKERVEQTIGTHAKEKDLSQWLKLGK